MRDRQDHQTGNLLQSPAAKRYARYAERQAAKGIRQRKFWMSDEEYEAVRKLLEEMRSEG